MTGSRQIKQSESLDFCFALYFNGRSPVSIISLASYQWNMAACFLVGGACCSGCYASAERRCPHGMSAQVCSECAHHRPQCCPAYRDGMCCLDEGGLLAQRQAVGEQCQAASSSGHDLRAGQSWASPCHFVLNQLLEVW